MLPNVPEEHNNEVSASILTSLIIKQKKHSKNRDKKFARRKASAKANWMGILGKIQGVQGCFGKQ